MHPSRFLLFSYEHACSQLLIRSAAISYHNQTTVSCSHIPATDEYLALLDHWLSESPVPGVEDPHYGAPELSPSQPSSYDYFFERLRKEFLLRFKPPTTSHSATAPQLIPSSSPSLRFSDVQVLVSLFSRASTDCNGIRSSIISIPPWLTPKHSVHIFEAAEVVGIRILGLSHAPASLAIVAGMNLCTVGSDYLPCSDQWKTVITFSVAGNEILAAELTVLLNWSIWTPESVRYQIWRHDGDGNCEDTLSQWVNEFVADVEVEMLNSVWILGNEIENMELVYALRSSGIGVKLQLDGKLEREVIGAALLAKLEMEEQKTDCFELSKCEDLREEADRIAGVRHPKISEDSYGQHREL